MFYKNDNSTKILTFENNNLTNFLELQKCKPQKILNLKTRTYNDKIPIGPGLRVNLKIM